MGRIGLLGRNIRWYVGALMGDSHYRSYVAHRRRSHPGEPVLTEAQYWRMRHRVTESSPTARCC